MASLQAEALTEIGKLLHKQRNYRRAAAQLQQAVDLRPDSLQVLWRFCSYFCLTAEGVCQAAPACLVASCLTDVIIRKSSMT